MKKYLFIAVCILAFLTSGCTNSNNNNKEAQNANIIAKNIAIASASNNTSKVVEQSRRFSVYNAELKYVKNVNVTQENVEKLKKYNLNAHNKHKCSITYYMYQNEEKFVGYCI